MNSRNKPGVFQPRLLAVSVAACFALAAHDGRANPTGPSVVSGSASFAAAGSALTVTNSANAIINWRGFSIGVNEITRFLQPSAASAVLNRVVGSGGVIPQSVIDGMLQSNGRVFLLNPMGVVIGSGAQIDVAGLVASSLHLSNEDFLAGRLRFAEVPGAGPVANHGSIETVAGGRVYLVAPDVQNSGIIRAPQGEILLAAGKSAELASDASPHVTVRITADSEQALNVGTLVAEAGSVGMYGALVRNSGVAEAGGAVAGPGGQIRFVASKDLTLDAGSRTAASGTSGGNVLLQAESGTTLVAGTVEAKGSAGHGGSVQALGVRVGVIGNGIIDASGDTGGGTVLVGGDYQGKNAEVQNAERALIGRDGVIRADAGTTGDGGRVIVWADGDTRFHGSISARGGAQSGNGGFVETSGKQHLTADGQVDLAAPAGSQGTWLLDPDDLRIVASSATYGALSYGDSFNEFPDGAESTLLASAIEGASATVMLSASNDVIFDTSINKAQGGLDVQAGNDIALNSQSITLGDGNLFLNAGGSITSSAAPGAVQLNVTGSVDLIAQGGVQVGGIRTFSIANGNDTNVNAVAYGGHLKVDSIVTGDTDMVEGSSNVLLDSFGGNVIVGNVQTGRAGNSDVDLYTGLAGGGVETGSIVTGGGGWTSAVWIDSDAHVTTGAISTGAAENAHVNIYANNGNVGTGNILVGSADGGEGNVNINAYNGGINTGDVFTAGGDYTDVSMYANGGGIHTGNMVTGGATYDSGVYLYVENSLGTVSTGNIVTGAAGQYSTVEIYDYSGNVNTGSIQTGPAENTYVQIEAAGSVTTGSIVTGAASANQNEADSGIYIQSYEGNVTTGSMQTGSASDPLSDAYSYVWVYAEDGSIAVQGSIVTGAATGQWDAESYVDLEAWGGTATTAGPVATGAAQGEYADSGIYVQGENGVSATSTLTSGSANAVNGGDAYSLVWLESYQGNVAAGNVQTGAATGQYVDSGIYVDAFNGSVSTGSLASGPANGGPWEAYSSIWLNAASTVTTGNVTSGPATSDSYADTSIGIFSGDSFYGGLGLDQLVIEGGELGLPSGGSIATGALSSGAATAADSFSEIALATQGGAVTTGTIATGAGAFKGVDILASADLTTGAIQTSSAQSGQAGGGVTLVSSAGSVIVNGMIDTRGAAGSDSVPDGSAGGNVMLLAPTSVQVGAPATFGVTRTVINTSGGAAAGAGNGGNAGSVLIDPVSITLTGVVDATGGAAAGGGAGGSGGNLDLFTVDANGNVGTGTITFINGGWSLLGGLGAPPGVDGLVTAEGTLIFIILESSALPPAVQQTIGASIAELLTATQSGQSGEEEDEDNGGLGSCKA